MDKSISSKRHSTLASLLRDTRQRASLSQAEVAARLDEPQSFVSKYEAGTRRLDLVELEQVADALGTTLKQIVADFEARS